MTITRTAPPLGATVSSATLPIAIIGAGPVGLAAAAQLLERGLDPLILEAGAQAGSAVSAWGHIRLFTPWPLLVDSAAGRLLAASGRRVPRSPVAPTGHELVAEYLAPLAAVRELRGRIRYGHRVTAVSRRGMDRTRSAGRADAPFLLRIAGPEGDVELLAAAVIDASGTWTNPNPVLASGLQPAADVSEILSPALPDVEGRERTLFAGRHTLVVGAGHSAANTLLALAAIDEPGTRVSWAIRHHSAVRVHTAESDELPARAGLGRRVDALVRSGRIELIDRLEIDAVTATDVRAQVVGRRAGESVRIDVDRVVVATGFRPDLTMLREVRLALDDVVEAPRALAPLIDPNLHSCGSVPPHGVVELAQPEPDFYIAGIKSYGRAPTFLLATGYEQVRSIAAELAGDRVAAREVRLDLPETGVCSTVIPPQPAEPAERAEPAGSCCG